MTKEGQRPAAGHGGHRDAEPADGRRRCPTTTGPAARSRSPAPSRTTSRRRTSLSRTTGCPTGSPFNTEKKSYAYFDPIAQKAFDANYDGEDDVNGLTTYRFTQNVGYDADGKPTDPVKYASLNDKNEGRRGHRAGRTLGHPGRRPHEPIKMTRYYAASAPSGWTR